MSVMKDFSTRLRKLREIGGLTQVQLADKLGVSRGSISYYENMDRVPDIEFLYNVSNFFGVSPHYMLGFSDNYDADNDEIGAVLGLSDESIYKIYDEIDQSALNSIIEDPEFKNLISIASQYFHSSCEIYFSEYLGGENVEYIEYLISSLFIRILKRIRCKYSDLFNSHSNSLPDTSETMSNFQLEHQNQIGTQEKDFELEKQKIDDDIRAWQKNNELEISVRRKIMNWFEYDKKEGES